MNCDSDFRRFVERFVTLGDTASVRGKVLIGVNQYPTALTREQAEELAAHILAVAGTLPTLEQSLGLEP